MVEVEARFPLVKAFSLPSVGDGSDGKIARRHIELGVKGPQDVADAAFAVMCDGLRVMGAEFQHA
jgi:hypothetical protein